MALGSSLSDFLGLGHTSAWGGVCPRVCGRASIPPRRFQTGAGLSPRVRARQLHKLCNLNPSRSVPACAGAPRYGGNRSVTAVKAVCPRVCGRDL